MLLNLRKSKKIVIWTVVLAFVLWGGFSVGTQFKKEGRYAGNVFGKDVTFQEFDRFYKASQLFNGNSQNAKDPSALRQNAWQGIIFSREAKRQKIDVSDSEIRQQILKLLEDQKIDPDNYAVWVQRGLQESPRQFEEQVKEVIRIQKLMARLLNSIPTSEINIAPDDVKKSFMEENDIISFELVRFEKKEDAVSLQSKLKTPEDWKKQKEAKSGGIFQPVGPLPTNVLAQILQLSPEDAAKINALEKDHFSGVVNVGKEFAILLITERKKALESDFPAAKEKFTELLKERKKQSLLGPKAQAILGRASLKDYMPGESVPSSSQ